jgi:hypothetical protein
MLFPCDRYFMETSSRKDDLPFKGIVAREDSMKRVPGSRSRVYQILQTILFQLSLTFQPPPENKKLQLYIKLFQNIAIK